MATIKDVAKLAGVSTTTVSHVINRTRYVAEDTSKAVWAAIEQLHYSPSAIARSLKINSTKSIGMIVTSSQAPYFAEIILAVENYCYQLGYSLLLCNSQNHFERIQNNLVVLEKKRVDGVLVMCSEYTPDCLDLLENFSILPMVVMDWGPSNAKTDLIQDNSFKGGYLATQYLLECGHRQIGIISGDLNKTMAKARYQGFLTALTENGLKVNPEWVKEGHFEPEDGYECMQQILALEQRPTAIFCCNDTMALGAMSAINQAGLSVPEDFSMIGYDDIHSSRYYSPPLTTVHQSKVRLGKMAMDLLLKRIEDKNCQSEKLQLQPELVIRKSVKKLSSFYYSIF
ncbi:transcriptional repressor PurR [Mergibacter septicus]|uniref:HTH-type transcriptional repressor PurR n=1 Tax=Mergibacter septicus TaxID=221402 RepID=UPI00117949EC|nr:HTH-type transcriptional repressor PurR [Mergibacter septicus]AWX13267.1 transcriptional repressor PurR [Mergibacter septicus]